MLERYHWPGNIRELENALERAIVLGAGDMLGVDALPESVRRERPAREPELVDLPEEGLDLEATLDELERRYLQRALDRTRGVQTKAAELLQDDVPPVPLQAAEAQHGAQGRRRQSHDTSRPAMLTRSVSAKRQGHGFGAAVGTWRRASASHSVSRTVVFATDASAAGRVEAWH